MMEVRNYGENIKSHFKIGTFKQKFKETKKLCMKNYGTMQEKIFVKKNKNY
jgi:hypothetical protein